MEILRVKDYTSSYGLVVACCIFPIVFILADSIFENYLITTLVVFGIYITAFVFFVRKLIKTENQYLIDANSEAISFMRYGTFKWSEVAGIEAYAQIETDHLGGSRHEAKYVRVNLVEEMVFYIRVTNCDYEYREIEQRLNKIGGLPKWSSIEQN